MLRGRLAYNVPSESPQEHYKRAVAIPLLDSLLAQVSERFSDEQHHVDGLLSLLPSIIVEMDTHSTDIMSARLLLWECDLPFPKSLGNELRRWSFVAKQGSESQCGQQSGSSIPDNLLLAHGECDKDSFPNIHCLLVIACTIPITSAEAEVIPLMRRNKTYLRSTMNEKRLSDLSVIAMNFGERVPVLMKSVKHLGTSKETLRTFTI